MQNEIPFLPWSWLQELSTLMFILCINGPFFSQCTSAYNTPQAIFISRLSLTSFYFCKRFWFIRGCLVGPYSSSKKNLDRTCLGLDSKVKLWQQTNIWAPNLVFFESNIIVGNTRNKDTIIHFWISSSMFWGKNIAWLCYFFPSITFIYGHFFDHPLLNFGHIN